MHSVHEIMKLHDNIPSCLFQSNVGPEHQSRIHIAVEPAQLLKGDIMVSGHGLVPALPVVTPQKGKTGSSESDGINSLRPPPRPYRPKKPVGRMKGIRYLKAVG